MAFLVPMPRLEATDLRLYLQVMDPRPCFVVDGQERRLGRVLTWRKDGDGPWRGLVEYTAPHVSGAALTYLHWRPASDIEPRDG